MEKHEIQMVQEALNVILAKELDVDGIVGKKTTRAVKEFQKMAKVQVDGIVGPQTKQAFATVLDQVAKTAQDLSKGFTTGENTFAQHLDWTNPVSVMSKLFTG